MQKLCSNLLMSEQWYNVLCITGEPFWVKALQAYKDQGGS